MGGGVIGESLSYGVGPSAAILLLARRCFLRLAPPPPLSLLRILLLKLFRLVTILRLAQLLSFLPLFAS